MKKSYTIIIFISLIFSKVCQAGVNIEKIAKWQNVKQNLMIDTQKLEIKEGILIMNLKNKGYQEREFNLNCNNLTGQEIFKNMKTGNEVIIKKENLVNEIKKLL